MANRNNSRRASQAGGQATKQGAKRTTAAAKKLSVAKKASAPVTGVTDAPLVSKIYLLDVGKQKYGDCVLCQFGNISVLIDGSHNGDDALILQQLQTLLGQHTTPVRVSLLIISHPHDDHIGCLPSLVANEQLSADWALVADPTFRWGEPNDTDDFFAGTDHKTRSLSEALLEEDRSDWPDAELKDFIDNAGTLVYHYRTLLRHLEEGGTKVIRNGTDDDAALLAAFSAVGLRIIGPDREHLEEAARLVQEARHDSLDSTMNAFASDSTGDVVEAYRSLMGGQTDAASNSVALHGLPDSNDECPEPFKPNKGAINLQSLVTRFKYGTNSFLFAGDMQFSCPEVESQLLLDSVAAMRERISAEAPFSFIKISHHGSYNAMNRGVLAQLGESKLYGICGGVKGGSHPHPNVLKLLEENQERLSWVRTDRNGLVSITFGSGEPQIAVSRGEISDPTPKVADETDFTDALEELARDSSESGGKMARLSLLETLGTAAFLETFPASLELARNPLYTIDVRFSDQQVLRGLAGASGANWFEIPVAAVESLTPLALSGGDPSKIVASVRFRPEFQTLARTFDSLCGRTDVAGASNVMPSFDGYNQVFDDVEADDDPAKPTADDLRIEGALDLTIGSTVANFGAVEPDTGGAPALELLDVPGIPLDLTAVHDFEGRTMPLDIGAVRAFLNSCMTSSPRVRYGLGAKVPFHGATPGRHFTRVDCSGFAREAIWRGTTPHLNFRDGSVIQHEWIRAQGFKRSTSSAALLQDGAIRIAFLRPQESPSRIGHVALVHNARTLESHGGFGPNSRPWTNTGWQARTFVYFLTAPAA